MQLSTMAELNRLLKFSNIRKRPPCKPVLVETMINYPDSVQEILENSPPCSVSFEDTEPTLNTEENTEKIIEVNKNLEISAKDTFLAKDYTEISTTDQETSHIKNSTLTFRKTNKTNKNTTEILKKSTIRVFLFGNTDYLDIKTDPCILISNFIKQILTTFQKTEKFMHMSLPFGTIPEAYNLWLIDEDTLQAETDFKIDKNSQIKDLGSKYYRLTAIEDYNNIKRTSSSEPLRLVSEITSGLALKIYFDENSTIISVNPNTTLIDLVPLLSKKFNELQTLNPDTYEFRITIANEEHIGDEECNVDRHLEVKSLGVNEIKICRKLYVDTPLEAIKDKESFTVVETQGVFEPNRFYMNKAQACAYKEYKIYTTDGIRREKKIMGIDQLRIHILTLAGSKKLLNQRIKPKKNMLKKIEELFRINERYEVLIENMISVHQDPKNLSCFYISYNEEAIKRKKYFETENSIVCTEIVAKITLLKNMSVEL